MELLLLENYFWGLRGANIRRSETKLNKLNQESPTFFWGSFFWKVVINLPYPLDYIGRERRSPSKQKSACNNYKTLKGGEVDWI